MSTSRTTSGLFKPTGDNKISLGTFGYINARNRQRAYNIVVREFKKSGITQATLASRMGKTPDVVCRLLSRPQNWEADTFSSLLFAISGAVPNYDLTYPLGEPDFAEQPLLERLSSRTSAEPADIVSLDDYRFGEFRSVRVAW